MAGKVHLLTSHLIHTVFYSSLYFFVVSENNVHSLYNNLFQFSAKTVAIREAAVKVRNLEYRSL